MDLFAGIIGGTLKFVFGLGFVVAVLIVAGLVALFRKK